MCMKAIVSIITLMFIQQANALVIHQSIRPYQIAKAEAELKNEQFSICSDVDSKELKFKVGVHCLNTMTAYTEYLSAMYEEQGFKEITCTTERVNDQDFTILCNGENNDIPVN